MAAPIAYRITELEDPTNGGVMGNYHKVSRKYLPLCVAEFQFRYNNRDNPNISAEAIRRC